MSGDPVSVTLRCPSPPHRAILGLVRAAIGSRPDPGLCEDLRASAPEDLVAIAFDTYVHVLVAAAFDRHPDLMAAAPLDLVIFFREMQSANARRNAAIIEQLDVVGRALAAAGLRGVVLKGGAELLAPTWPDPAFRFLSDIDILVAGSDLARTVACLERAGALPDPEAPTDYSDHHHATPLSRVDWIVPVEPHSAIGPDPLDSLVLPPEDVLAAATPSDIPGLYLPSLTHRLAHAVLHAQLLTPRFSDHEFSLRDALELEFLSRGMTEADRVAARTRFATTGTLAAWQALDAARRLSLATGTQGDIDPVLPGPALAWAANAIELFGRPRRRRITGLLRTLRRYGTEMLFDSRRRRHHFRHLASPSRLRRIIAYQRKVFRRKR